MRDLSEKNTPITITEFIYGLILTLGANRLIGRGHHYYVQDISPFAPFCINLVCKTKKTRRETPRYLTVLSRGVTFSWTFLCPEPFTGYLTFTRPPRKAQKQLSRKQRLHILHTL